MADRGLRIEAVSHAYGRRPVLREASLAVLPGEIHCLLGPSGSGKTTLLRLAAGLERLQQGAIYIAGEPVAGPTFHVPPERRAIGFMFQDYALFPHLSVYDNIAFGMKHHRRKDERQARIAALLESVDLVDYQRAMPHTLSGGQQQRVALVRALASDPQIMLLDEPFSGLDARLRGEIRDVTLRVLKDAGVATLMVTHDPPEAMAIADSISVIDQGRIEQTGAPAEVYHRPNSLRVAETFGEINTLAGRVVDGRVETPWGSIAAPGFDDGDQVEILIRPEAFHFSEQAVSGSVPAEIVARRPQGHCARFELLAPAGQRLRVLTWQDSGHQLGARVHLGVDLSRALVFPHPNGRGV